MYETPKLNYVGEAHEVVLGLGSPGIDLDVTFVSFDMLFAADPEPGSEPL